MTISIDALWVNVSPALQKFHQPLLRRLSRQQIIACWEYQQTLDEPISLTVALVLLHDYLKSHDKPVHLIGHSIGGLLALLYARRYPERVQSLTLLGVGVYPAIDWHAHFYALLQLLPCNRETILTQMVHNLFGSQPEYQRKKLIQVLEDDLSNSLSPHTLWRRVSVKQGGANVPMLVCGSYDDVVIEPHLFQTWQPFLKEGDRLWQCPSGKHFFHYFQPTPISQQILDFWSSFNTDAVESECTIATLRGR